MKLMAIPVGRSLVFSGSQAKNISYPADHRQKISCTLPQMAWGGEFFSSDIMWWLGDWTLLILHQLPLPRKSPKRGKDILVSTVLYLRWLGEENFLVQILCGGSVIGHTTDPAPAHIASKEPEKGKRYFGLCLLVGGVKQYDMESDLET